MLLNYKVTTSTTERSVVKTRWQWSVGQHRYDRVLPYIADEVIGYQQEYGALSSFNSTSDSSRIFEVVDKYRYMADEYKVKNGYRSAVYIGRRVSARKRVNQGGMLIDSGTYYNREIGVLSVGLSQQFSTMNDY
jgi:hypothetical protein